MAVDLDLLYEQKRASVQVNEATENPDEKLHLSVRNEERFMRELERVAEDGLRGKRPWEMRVIMQDAEEVIDGAIRNHENSIAMWRRVKQRMTAKGESMLAEAEDKHGSSKPIQRCRESRP